MLIGHSVNEHVRLGSDDGGVDESKEEEPSDERAQREVGRVRVLPLQDASGKDARRVSIGCDVGWATRVGRLTLVRLLICLQIHLIPYGTVSMASMMVDRKLSAISMSIVRRGRMMPCTSVLAAATSGDTPRGRLSGTEPRSSSIWLIICSYTCASEVKADERQ